MDTSAPELLNMGDLINVAKSTFDRTAAAGAFFFPKVVWQYEGEGQWEVAQYDSQWEAFREVCRLAARRPLRAISHTSDSYYLDLRKVDPLIAELRKAGKVSNEELFEAGTPGVFEALSIVIITADSYEAVYVPYLRHPNRIEWLEPVYPDDDTTEIRGRYPRRMRAAVQFSQRAS